MASLPAPKTKLTKRLQPSQRQFFQWFYREAHPIQWVKNEMDKLSISLRDVSGENFAASEDAWRNRQRQWNEKEWHIKNKDRGPHLVMPASLLHLTLWRKGNKDVGDWRSNGKGIEEPSYHHSFVDKNSRLQIDQTPCGGFNFASPYEENDPGLNSYDSHSETLRTPSLSSPSSETPSVSSNSWYSFPESQLLPDNCTLEGTTNIFDPFTGIHPPQMSLLETQINIESFYDQKPIIQSMHSVSSAPASSFDSDHLADGNLTHLPDRMEAPSYNFYHSGAPYTSSHNLPSRSLYPTTYSHTYVDNTRPPNEDIQSALEWPTPPGQMIQPSDFKHHYDTSKGPNQI